MSNQTHFHHETPERIRRELEYARERRRRVRIWYGNTATGQAWADEFDVIGRIDRSTGTRKIPILVNNARSSGGPAILDHCIVRIDTTTGITLYRHPSFKSGFEGYTVKQARNGFELYDGNGELYSLHRTREQARRLAEFMRGERYSK